jgi:hypothetical protein
LYFQGTSSEGAERLISIIERRDTDDGVREVRMGPDGMRIAGLLDSDGDIVPSARPAEPPCKPSLDTACR